MFVRSGNGIYPGYSQRPAQNAFGTKAGGGIKLQAPKTNPKARAYMRDATAAMKRLQEAIGCAKAANVFMGPQSTDTFAVSLRYTGSRFDSFADITMNVEQEARAGQNSSFAQALNGADYAAGSHTFALEVNGKSHELTINVAEGESNAAVQQKMAQAINSAGLGLTAGLSTHEGLSTLAVTTNGMGDDAVSFSIKDVSGTLVHTSGIDRVAQQAQNAVYTVNGTKHTSTSNTVEVGNGITATIRGASKGDFSITDGFNKTNAQNIMSILYTPLNDLKTIADAMEKETGIDTLALQMASLFNQFGAVFGAFGVTTDTNGLFTIDFGKAQNALADGSLRGFLQDFYQTGGGFIGYLEALAGGSALDLTV